MTEYVEYLNILAKIGLGWVGKIWGFDAVRTRDPRFLRFYARRFFTHDFENRTHENNFRMGALIRFLKIGA